MERLRFGALRVRGWSRGCELCWEGAKMVVFSTGVCPLYGECPYCTITADRRGRDVSYADEVEIRGPEDLIFEAEAIGAGGAGITGGEPSEVPERVERWVRLLKEEFGSGFHVHLYTNARGLTPRILSRWADAGLDEIRIHSWREEDWSFISEAKDLGMSAGAEVPAIPGRGWVRRLKELAGYVDRVGGDFVNLNELEFSEVNRDVLRSWGLVPRPDSEVAVSGSAEAAEEVLRWVEAETSIMGYFCPAEQKDYQMWARWRRRAERVALDHETPTDDGTLAYGIVSFSGDPDRVEAELRGAGVRHLARVGDGVAVRPEELLDPSVLDRLIRMGATARLVEVSPTDDRIELASYPWEYLLRRVSRSEEEVEG